VLSGGASGSGSRSGTLTSASGSLQQGQGTPPSSQLQQQNSQGQQTGSQQGEGSGPVSADGRSSITGAGEGPGGQQGLVAAPSPTTAIVQLQSPGGGGDPTIAALIQLLKAAGALASSLGRGFGTTLVVVHQPALMPGRLVWLLLLLDLSVYNALSQYCCTWHTAAPSSPCLIILCPMPSQRSGWRCGACPRHVTGRPPLSRCWPALPSSRTHGGTWWPCCASAARTPISR
jgi:hypothetical protein